MNLVDLAHQMMILIHQPTDGLDCDWLSRSVAPRLARTKAIRVPGIIVPVVADEKLFPSGHRPCSHVASIGVLKGEVWLSKRGVIVTVCRGASELGGEWGQEQRHGQARGQKQETKQETKHGEV